MIPSKLCHISFSSMHPVWTAGLPQTQHALVVQLLQVLEERQRPYVLEIISSKISEAVYMRLLLAVLLSDFPQALSFRGCQCLAPRWKRLEAYILLSYHLWREGSAPRRFVDDENPVELPGNLADGARVDRVSEKERREFAQRLLDDWIVHRKVRCLVFRRI
jgi:hypothetical protein